MKSFIKKIVGESTYVNLLNYYKDITGGHSTASYSQEGEDLILLREFYGEKKGFYIDVGAYHPKRFSNTFLFYKMGWRGINIDARPGSMSDFNKFRSRDINLEIPVGEKTGMEMNFYTFNEPAISGFHEQLSLLRAQEQGYKIIKVEKMKTQTLAQILDKYLPENTEISFLSIDVEGFDFDVLKSNNWQKYRPKVILVEELSASVSQALDSSISVFLKSHNYTFFSKTPNTSFYRRDKNG